MEEDVLRLQVVVDHLIRQLMQVFDSTHYLSEYESCLFLGDALMLLEIVGKIRALAVLHDSAERGGIDIDRIIQLDNIGMAEQLMHIILPQCMLDVILLGTVVPIAVELMQLHCHLTQLLAVETLVHLTETTLT
jgi:hypothetical protein